MNKNTKETRNIIKIYIQQAKCIEKTMEQILVKTGSNIGYNFASCNDFAKQYQTLLDGARQYIFLPCVYTEYNIDNFKSVYDMTGIEQMKMFHSVLSAVRLLIASLEGNFDYVEDELNILDNFINSKLRLMFNSVPDNEKEVQDNLERLFVGNNMNKGVDYDRETGKFNFSGREYIPDFIIPNLNCCIEVKLLKDKTRKSKLIEEINADITAYGKKYDEIIFVVYDVGIITDVLEFKRDIESSGNVKVILIKH